MATIEKRTTATGAVSYRAKVRLRGESPRTRTFKRMTDAKAWAAKVESDLGHGAYVPTTADRRRTLADLIDKYLTEYLPVKASNRDADGHRAILAWWRKEYGFVTLDRLRPDVFTEARARLAARTNPRTGEPVSGATVNRYLAGISSVCKWAWKEQGWLPGNPLLSVSKLREGEGVVRWLDDEERRRLLQACRESSDRNIHCAVILALATGLRYGNIRFLRWEDVDRDTWTLTIRETKNGTPRNVPIVGAAQAALTAHLAADPTGAGWVFKGATDAAPADFNGKVWRAIRDAAGLQNLRFHDLRHTTASYLTQGGAGLAQVAEAMGHKTLAMARRYSHQNPEHVRATLASIVGKLGEE